MIFKQMPRLPENAALRKTSSENVIVTPEPRRERNLSPETRHSLIPNKENLKKYDSLTTKKQPRHQTAKKNGFRSSDGCKNGVTKPFCTYPQKSRSIKDAPYSGRQQRRSLNEEKTTVLASAQNTKKPRQKRKNNNTKNRKIHRKTLRYSEPE